MTNSSARRRLAGLLVSGAVALGAWGWTGPTDPAPAEPATVRAASIRDWFWWWPTTTKAPVTTTTKAPTTTVAPTTTRAPVTTTTTKAPVTTTTKAPTTTVAPTTTQPPTTGGMPSSLANELLTRVNARRATGTTCGGVWYPPVGPLALQGNLATAADGHARDMATNHFFSHTGSNGSDVGSRATAAGYRWSALGENIAAGQTTAQSVVDGWYGSAGHCVNFMSGTFVHIGFARAENAADPYRFYWVADMGRPR